MRALGLTISLALACSLTGCPSPSDDVPLDQLANRLAIATCGYADRCAASTVGFTFGGADCVSTYGAYADEQLVAQIRAGVAAGTLAYHPEAAGACLDFFATIACGATVSGDTSVCNELFEGLVPDGSGCDIEQECGATSTCNYAAELMCPRGTCQHIAQLGEPCMSAVAGMGCDADLRCAQGVCAQYAMQGESCTATGAECGSGLRCSATSGAGTCGAPPVAQLGEACDSATCAAGLVCAVDDTEMFVCSAPRTDGTCREVLGAGDCSAPQICNGATFTSDGTCGLPAGEGQSCMASECAAGLHCTTPMGSTQETCVVLQHIGESCADDSDCYSDYCDVSVCASAPLCHT